jgi:hypothetical protein
MNIPLPTNQPTTPAVCRMLRTKTALGNYVGDDYSPWELAESTTAAYWCLCTMTPAGPDDHFAHPDQCREGRCCYQAREG